jgi:cell division septation protein DedD
MLDKKINALLFTHDCVIIPGLGGFVASQAAAKHNAIQHTFIPPARVIAFNVYLRQNDGLLANFISAEEKVSFTDAMKIIERYVERCFMELEAGRKVTVTDIGQLYYDNEKNIQFSPDAAAVHAFDSFGLTSLRAVPVVVGSKKDLLLSPLRASAKKEKSLVEKKKKSGRKYGSRLVNTGLVAGVLLWAMFNVYIIAPRNFNFSALNPFERTDSDRIRPVRPDTVKQEETAPKNITPAAPIVQPSENKVAPSPAEEKSSSENISTKVKAEPVPAAPAKETAIAGNYYTVVGVFNVRSNAENMLSKLHENGYQNAGSIERENKPTMVYAAQYGSKTEALQSLQQLKEHGLDAWILGR